MIMRLLCIILFSAGMGFSQSYEWTLLNETNEGYVIPFVSESDAGADFDPGFTPMFPSILAVPQGSGYEWLELPDPSARYLMYYAYHRSDHISLAWAPAIEGPWQPYNNSEIGNGSQGVMSRPEGWDHISAPDIYLDSAKELMVMLFHGQDDSEHTSFVATSKTGLDFDGFIEGGTPQSGIHSVTIDGKTTGVYTSTHYAREFFYDADGDGVKELYSVGKRQVISKAPDDDPATEVLEPFMNTSGEFDLVWTLQEGSLEEEFTYAGSEESRPDIVFHGPITEFMRSTEFAEHPNNPNPGYFCASQKTDADWPEGDGPGWVNHGDGMVGDFDYDGVVDELEVFFWIKNTKDDAGDKPFYGIYRVVMDLTDRRTQDEINNGVEPFHSWTLHRDSLGLVMFEVFIDPDDVSDGSIELGDPHLFTDTDGQRYLFFAYGPEGSIAAMNIVPTREPVGVEQIQKGIHFDKPEVQISHSGITVFGGSSEELQVRLLSLNGQLQHRVTAQGKVFIPQQQLSAGVSLVQVKWEAGSLFRKIVID